jgi:hypothetical protein
MLEHYRLGGKGGSNQEMARCAAHQLTCAALQCELLGKL